MSVFLSQYLFYPVYELVTGRRILSKLRQVERTQWRSPAEIEALKQERLCNLLTHAYRHVPFYQQRIAAQASSPEQLADPERFGQLPLLTKDDILVHRDEMVATNFPSSALKLDATGGSTGHTLSFYNDRVALDFRSAVTIRGDRWAGLDIGTPHSRLWGAPLELEAQERFINRLTNWVLRRQWLDCFRLSENVLSDYVRQMRRFHPRVLMGYTSALITMARFIAEHNIRDIGLSSVISSAETLLDEQRSEIESAFGCKVYNRYGCREAGPIAVECPEGNLHVNADYLYLELIRGGRRARPGEMGEIVITPLFSYGMPLIRYRIGDLGVAAGEQECPCGRGLPLIKRVLGRTSDMFVNSQGEAFHGEYFTHLFYHRPGVRQFQAIQPDTEHLRFKIVPAPDFDSRVFAELEKKIHDFIGPMEVQWELVEEIPPFKSGKRAFTLSLVPVDYTAAGVGL
jgi:phenylacetate-CoA ligase